MITKNISVIQGQNPDGTFSAAKLDKDGYLLTSSAETPSSQTSVIATTLDLFRDPLGNPLRYSNAIAGPLDSSGSIDTEMLVVGTRCGSYDSIDNTIGVNEGKLLVEQGKQFQTGEVYVADTNTFSSENDVSNFINTSIGNWVSSHGPRYDDIIISYTPGAVSKSFLIVTIIRYY